MYLYRFNPKVLTSESVAKNVIKDWLSQGGNINQMVDDETLLMWSVSMDYPDLASFLISKGASINMTNSKGLSAKFLASSGSPRMKAVFR